MVCSLSSEDQAKVKRYFMRHGFGDTRLKQLLPGIQINPVVGWHGYIEGLRRLTAQDIVVIVGKILKRRSK